MDTPEPVPGPAAPPPPPPPPRPPRKVYFSTFEAVMSPRRPVYLNAPLWPLQAKLWERMAYNFPTTGPDLLSISALAFVAQFKSREELYATLDAAFDLYALGGAVPKLPFQFGWPADPFALPWRLRAFAAAAASRKEKR